MLYSDILIYVEQDVTLHSLFYLETALHVSGRTTTHHQKRQVAVTVWQIPDVVDRFVCVPDDGWWYKPKHVEQFPDEINCATSHLFGYILEYIYDARTHECKKKKI